MKKFALVLLLLALGTGGAFAQTVFEVPAYSFRKPADYAKYEADIVKAANWLEENPLGKSIDKRKEINTFVLEWLMGTDKVTISLSEKLLAYTEKNPDLLGVYMASYARYELAHPESESDVDAIKAALLSIAAVYENSPTHEKEKALEKLIADKANVGKYAQDLLTPGK